MAEAARIKEEEALRREQELAEQARLREIAFQEAAKAREEEARKRE